MSHLIPTTQKTVLFLAVMILFAGMAPRGTNRLFAQTPNAVNGGMKRSIFSPPDAAKSNDGANGRAKGTTKKKTVPYRTATSPMTQRRSENPPRFVFSPKEDPNRPKGADPSAAAIWSTLITGNMSPEIVRWHLYQREVNQQIQSVARTDPAAAERIRASLREEKRSDYEKMLARTEFSLAPNRGQNATNPEPSGSAIVARLLTGQQNGEIRQWKARQAVELAAATRPSEYLPGAEREAVPMIAPSETQYAAMRQNAPVFREAPVPPRLESLAARMEPLPESTQTTAAIPAGREFLDDDFPAAPIRQVAATLPNEPTPVRPLETLSEDEPVNRPGKMKVYRPRDSSRRTEDGVVAVPLPETIDEESWRPVEPSVGGSNR